MQKKTKNFKQGYDYDAYLILRFKKNNEKQWTFLCALLSGKQ